MGVRIDIQYDGDLQCTAVHGPSGDRLTTDPPVDNQGRGAHFSPTDLAATALGTCIMTVVGIAARARGLDLGGSRVTVEKEMGAVPVRHISRLKVDIVLPARLDAHAREMLELAGRRCPVAASFGERTVIDLVFRYE